MVFGCCFHEPAVGFTRFRARSQISSASDQRGKPFFSPERTSCCTFPVTFPMTSLPNKHICARHVKETVFKSCNHAKKKKRKALQREGSQDKIRRDFTVTQRGHLQIEDRLAKTLISPGDKTSISTPFQNKQTWQTNVKNTADSCYLGGKSRKGGWPTFR